MSKKDRIAKEAGIKIDNCMKVMKFGGTSVGSVNSILSVKQIVEAVGEPVIVVVSAILSSLFWKKRTTIK